MEGLTKALHVYPYSIKLSNLTAWAKILPYPRTKVKQKSVKKIIFFFLTVKLASCILLIVRRTTTKEGISNVRLGCLCPVWVWRCCQHWRRVHVRREGLWGFLQNRFLRWTHGAETSRKTYKLWTVRCRKHAARMSRRNVLLREIRSRWNARKVTEHSI